MSRQATAAGAMPPPTDVECAICVDTPAPGTEVATLRCGHRYCRGCIEGWWARPGPKTCPTCLRCCVISVAAAAPVDTQPVDTQPVGVKRPRAAAGSGSTSTTPKKHAPSRREGATRPVELEKFVVLRILKKQLLPSGATEYHTLREGYPEAEATWEPAESFAGCRGLLATFERGLELVAAGVVVEQEVGRRRRNDPDGAGWEAQLARLAAHKAAHGDCNVPQVWAHVPRAGLPASLLEARRCCRILRLSEAASIRPAGCRPASQLQPRPAPQHL